MSAMPQPYDDADWDIAGATKPERFDDRTERCANLVASLRPQRVLDVGCGDGFLLEMLRSRGVPAEGLYGVERRDDTSQLVSDRGFRCHTGDVEQPYPFEESFFDVVVAGEIIEHVVDPDRMLREFRRVLKPDGRLLLPTPNLLCWYNRILALFGITPMFVEHSFKASYGPAYSLFRRVGPAVGHLRIFTLTTLRMVLAQNGFRCLQVSGAARAPVRSLWLLDRALARLNPRLAAQFIVLADLTPSS